MDNNGQSAIPLDNTIEGKVGRELLADLLSRHGLDVLPQLVLPHWSRSRDKQLYHWSFNNDYFLITMYNILTKVSAIEFVVHADERNSPIDNKIAKAMTEHLQGCWYKEITKFLLDVSTQDNGGFLELLGGGGDTTEPLPPVAIGGGSQIKVPATRLKHWEAGACIRTGVDEYPVKIIYDGNDYLMHHSRVIEYSQLPSPKMGLNGVGFCPASRCLNTLLVASETDSIILDNVIDGLVNSLIFAQPMDSTIMLAAYNKARSAHNPQQGESGMGASKKRKAAFIGVEGKVPLSVHELALKRLPEGYNRITDTPMTMYLMAAAFSADAREVMPATASGATKADAETQNKKSAYKFTRQFINLMERHLSKKFVPIGFKVKATYTDTDEELRQIEVRNKLSQTHKQELENGTITIQIAAEQMRNAGFLTEQQFEDVAIASEQILGVSEITIDDVARLFPPVKAQKDISQKDEYQRRLQKLLDVGGNENDIINLTMNAVIAAFLRGSNKTIEQLTPTDLQALQNQRDIADNSIKHFLRTGGQTIELWANTVEAVAQAAMLFRADNPLMQWRIDPAKDNCNSCLQYNGQVKRKSEWLALGLYPRMKGDTLTCGGWRCGCGFYIIGE